MSLEVGTIPEAAHRVEVTLVKEGPSFNLGLWVAEPVEAG